MRFDFDNPEKEGYLLCVLSKRYGLFFEEKGNRWVCDVDPSLNVFIGKTGNYLVKDFGSGYPQFARAKGLKAVLSDIYGQDLHAKINELAGCNYAPAQAWVDRENARNSSGNTAAQSAFACCPTAAVSDSPQYDGTLPRDGTRTRGQGQDKKTEKSPSEKPAEKQPISFIRCDWGSAQGQNVLRFFEEKAGITKGAAEFLAQYGIFPISEKSGVKDGKNWRIKFPTGGENAGFVIAQSGWEKIRETKPAPLKNGEKPPKYLTNKAAQPYLFGFDALPLSGENLFVFESETDALAFAFHTGAPVLCLGGTSNFDALPLSIAAELKRRFKNIFVFWDNDKEKKINTGQLSAQIFADKHGFTFVDTAFLFSYSLVDAKDICDLIQKAIRAENRAAGIEKLRLWAALIPETNGRILAYADDRFSVPVAHVLTLPFKQYLSEDNGEPVDFVNSALLVHGKVAVISPAGTGKSVMLSQLAQRHKAEKIIIAVPTITLAKQLQEELLKQLGIIAGVVYTENDIKEALSVGLVYGEMNTQLLESERAARVIISTFDGCAEKVNDLIKNSLFVVDEYHQLVSEYTYRKDAVRAVLAGIQTADNVLLLSATPDYLLSDFLGTKVVLCSPEKTNKIILKVVKTSTKRNQIMPVVCAKEAETIAAGHTVLFKLDNVNALRAAKEYVDFTGQTADIFTSKDGENERNKNYNSIVKGGQFAEKPNFLLFTTIIEAGVSIRSSAPSVYICDKPNAQKIIQISARPRFGADGTNAVVNVTVLFSAKDKKKENSTESAKQIFERMRRDAQELADKFTKEHQNGQAGNVRNKMQIDADLYVYCADKDAGVYAVDALAIFEYIRTLADSEQTAELLCKRITRLDKRFICSVESWESYTNADKTEIDKRRAAEKERAAAEMSALILRETNADFFPQLVKIAARKLKKDKKERAKITKPFGVIMPKTQKENEELRAEIAEFACKYPVVFSGYSGLLPLVRRAAFYAAQGESTQKAFNKAAQISSKEFVLAKDLQAAKARKQAIKEGVASAKDKQNALWKNAVCAKINKRNYKIKNENGAKFTADSLKELVDATRKEYKLPPTKSKNAAVDVLKRFYEIEIKCTTNKAQKTIKNYTLTRRKEG